MLKQFHTSKPQSLLVVKIEALKSLSISNCIIKKTKIQDLNCLLNPTTLIPFSPKRLVKNWNFSSGVHPKCVLGNNRLKSLSISKKGKTQDLNCLLNPTTSITFSTKPLVKNWNFPIGVQLKSVLGNDRLVGARCFSALGYGKIGESIEKNLPWLEKDKAKQNKRNEKVVRSRSSWEESAEKFLKGGVSAAESSEFKRYEDRRDGYKGKNYGEVDKARRDKKDVMSRSSWEDSGEKFVKRGVSTVKREEFKRFEDRREDYQGGRYSGQEDDYVDEGDMEEGDDPRWDKIKNRFNRIRVKPPGSDRPEVRRWNNQESWGKKTWKEASESSIPNMVGECVYGVGPVLAALSSARREFYALYVQEGLDLSGNNRKKKDKKGFERVLRMAEKLGLSKKEVSKHDLNMIADNRPHQGLVLDASPLEMVGIKELEPVAVEDDNVPFPLWVALDEVTDPQNLGAIIRSAYFFGASGIVLCAKNSAPLSGVVSKASAGSLELVELRSCKNMMQFLTSSAENGWRVLGGSVSSRAVALHEVVPGAPTILVLGSEGTGLRPLVERSCTELVKIPGNIPVDIIAGGEEDDDAVDDAEKDHSFSGQNFRSFMAVESLNVSVAAGVLLHHLIGTNYSKATCKETPANATLFDSAYSLPCISKFSVQEP